VSSPQHSWWHQYPDAQIKSEHVCEANFYNGDPLAWLADVLARIADIPQSQLPEATLSSRATRGPQRMLTFGPLDNQKELNLSSHSELRNF
jgi:hypothetical protein